jgi:hypothetical protein
MTSMLMIAPAPVVETGARLRLDVKFVEAMRVQQAPWPGRITVLLRRGSPAFPFGRDYDRDDPGRVRLHGAVDFDTALVPFTRTGADMFLGCHRQSDPSCTYLEATGCGVAIAGHDNRIWSGLNAAAEAG